MQMTHKNKIIEDLTASVKQLAVGVVHKTSTAQGRPFSCGEAAAHAGQASAPRVPFDGHSGQRSAGPSLTGNSNTIRVDIPQMPVSKTLTSIENVWKEFTEGTESKPAIRQLINDHGSEWQQARYGYDRKIWSKKKKIICAIEALQQSESISAHRAVSFVTKLAGKQVNAFAEALPVLAKDIDVSGFCKSSSGEWRRLQPGDDEYSKYSEYVKALHNHLKLKQSVKLI